MQMHSPVCVYILVCGCPDAGVCEQNTQQLSSLEPCACSEGANERLGGYVFQLRHADNCLTPLNNNFIMK